MNKQNNFNSIVPSMNQIGFEAKGKEILTPKEVQITNDIDMLK